MDGLILLALIACQAVLLGSNLVSVYDKIPTWSTLSFQSNRSVSNRYCQGLPRSLTVHVVEVVAESWVPCKLGSLGFSVNVGRARSSRWAASSELLICSCVQIIIMMNTMGDVCFLQAQFLQVVLA